MFHAVQAWATPLRAQSVMVLSDSRAVCSYINRQGGTHSRSLCQLTVSLFHLCQSLSITLMARLIPGRLNVIADSLYRQRPLATEWSLHPLVFQAVQLLYPNMSIDLFATRYNIRLPLFVSPFPDELAMAVDGLSLSWSGRDCYAFPPTALVPLILAKLETEDCALTLVAPLQWRRPWITPLQRLCLHAPLRLPLLPDLLTQPISNQLHANLEGLNLHVFRLSGRHYPARDIQQLSLTGFATLDMPRP